MVEKEGSGKRVMKERREKEVSGERKEIVKNDRREGSEVRRKRSEWEENGECEERRE